MSVPGGILSLRGGMVGPNSRTLAAAPQLCWKNKTAQMGRFTESITSYREHYFGVISPAYPGRRLSVAPGYRDPSHQDLRPEPYLRTYQNASCVVPG